MKHQTQTSDPNRVHCDASVADDRDLKRSPEPMAVFHHGTYDYVSDVKWCPTHPAVFSSVTSGGDLYLWNLTQSLEVNQPPDPG
jgi:hypothetical protein